MVINEAIVSATAFQTELLYRVVLMTHCAVLTTAVTAVPKGLLEGLGVDGNIQSRLTGRTLKNGLNYGHFPLSPEHFVHFSLERHAPERLLEGFVPSNIHKVLPEPHCEPQGMANKQQTTFPSPFRTPKTQCVKPLNVQTPINRPGKVPTPQFGVDFGPFCTDSKAEEPEKPPEIAREKVLSQFQTPFRPRLTLQRPQNGLPIQLLVLQH